MSLAASGRAAPGIKKGRKAHADLNYVLTKNYSPEHSSDILCSETLQSK